MADMSDYLNIANAAGDRVQDAYITAESVRALQEKRRKEREAEQWRQQTADRLQGLGLGAPVQPPGAQGATPPVGLGPPPASAGLASLIQNESGGNYGAKNDAVGHGGAVGHFGKYQFGQARLQDYSRATGEKIDPNAFLSNKEQQERVARWHFNDIDRFVRQNNLDRYIGQEVAGIPITQDGLRAMAHLGGNAGMAKFLATGGKYNPADTNGTRLSDYASKHRGAAAPGGQPSQGQPPAPIGDTNKAAQIYHEIVIDAFRKGQLEQAKPLLAHIAAQGFAAHMASFQGDPSTPEGGHAYALHMGQGAGAFGRDPWEVANQAATRAQAWNTTRQNDTQEKRLQAAQDVLMEERADGKKDKESKRAEEEQKRALDAYERMVKFMEIGAHEKAKEAARALGWEIQDIQEDETSFAPGGTAHTYKYTYKNQNGDIVQGDTAQEIARIAAKEASDKLHSVEQRDEWGEVKSKGWGVPRKDAAGNPYLQEVPVRPAVAGLGAAQPAPAANNSASSGQPSRSSRGISNPEVGIVDEAGNIIYANGERFMHNGAEYVVNEGKPIPARNVRY